MPARLASPPALVACHAARPSGLGPHLHTCIAQPIPCTSIPLFAKPRSYFVQLAVIDATGTSSTASTTLLGERKPVPAASIACSRGHHTSGARLPWRGPEDRAYRPKHMRVMR